MTDLQTITTVEAQRLGVPAAATCAGLTVLALPGGGVLEMPASMAREAAEALLYVTDARVGGVGCPACRHALVCSQLSRIRHALTLRDYLCDGGEDLILQTVASACELFEADAGRYNGENAPITGE